MTSASQTVVVIRPYKTGDEAACRRLLSDATMSTVGVAFRAAIMREITLQLVVVFAAGMFIFCDLTPIMCLLSVPLTALVLYMLVYLGHLYKVHSIDDDVNNIENIYMCTPRRGFWVAEAISSTNSGLANQNVIISNEPMADIHAKYRRVIGTAAVVESTTEDRSARLRRMAVAEEFRRHRVASALVDAVLDYSRKTGYSSVELVTTECHSAARKLYYKKGFELRQLYHKQIIGTLANAYCKMMESLFMLTACYAFFAMSLVYHIPPLVSCGLTIESIFSSFLGSEVETFVSYHVMRTNAALLGHSFLPLGYVLLMLYAVPDLHLMTMSLPWQLLFTSSLCLFSIAAFRVLSWRLGSWLNHPLMNKLRCFTGGVTLKTVVTDIDMDFKSPRKTVIFCNATSKVIVTNHWIMKTSMYGLDVAKMNEASMSVVHVNEYEAGGHAVGGVQYLNIRVDTGRPNVPSFHIRIDSTYFKDLKNAVQFPINVMGDIRVKATLQDKFLTTFKEQVLLNPSLPVEDMVEDDCWGCSEKRPNVKILKTCGDDTGENACEDCMCRPMWCIDCLGIWFASRQDQETPHRWMASKATCPMCRCRFCVLDVCYLDTAAPRQPDEPEPIS